jgi:UDP-glucose 4-epimerase
MSTILVTGGAGFIGSHVVDAFVAAGHSVSVVDSLAHGRRENLNPAAEFYQADLRDAAALDAIFREVQPEYISHQAALVSVRESLDAPAEYAAVNILGGINVLEMARRYGVRKIIYACTGGAAYGEGQGLPPFTEDYPPGPLDPYGTSKVALEYYLRPYYRNFGLDYVSLRYPNVYGPRQDPFGEGGVVAIFAQRMISGQPCTIYGNGTKQRDFVYAGDVAHANLLALSHGRGIYNLGSGVATDIQAIFCELRAACPGYALDPLYGPDKPGEVWVSRLDASKIRAELGWAPRVSLAEGLAATLDYFRRAPGPR